MWTNDSSKISYDDTVINRTTCHGYHFTIYKFIFLVEIFTIQG